MGEDAAPAVWASGRNPVGEAAGGAVGGFRGASAGAVGGSAGAGAVSGCASGGSAGSDSGRSKTLTYSPRSLYTLIVLGGPPSVENNFTVTELVSVLTNSSIVQLTRSMLRSLSSGLS